MNRLQRLARSRFSRAAAAAVGIGCTAVLATLAVRAPVEQSSASMNARNEARNKAYRDFKRTFGNDEIVLLSVTHPRLLEPEGLRVVDEMTTFAAALDGTTRVESLTTLRQLVRGPWGAEEAPLVPRPFSRPGARAELDRALDRNPWIFGLLLSRDRRTAGIAIGIENRPGDDRYRGEILRALRDAMRTRSGEGAELHLTGITVQKHDVARFVDGDRRRILPMSALVLALALVVIFRRPSGVLLPLAATLTTVAWTLGLYAALGYSVNVLTSLLPPVIMVLSISTSVHVYQAWLDAGPLSRDRREAARRTARRMLVPCFLTTLTTALGLASLTVSEIPAVRQFGMFAALGTMLSFGFNFTILPAAFRVLPLAAPHSRGGGRRARALARLGDLSARHPGVILGLAGAVTLAALGGIGLIRNNTDLVRFLSEDSPLYRDTMFIDEQLTGVNALELVVGRSDGAPLTTPDDLRRLDALDAAVRELPDVSAVLGLPDLIGQIHRAENGLPEPRIPDDPDDALACFDLLEAADDPRVASIVTPDFTSTHVSVRIHAVGTARAQRIIEAIVADAGRALGPGWTVTPRGSFYNVTMDSNRLVASQVKSLSLALVTVLLAMAAWFRSRRLLLAALIPNLMPVLWTGGLMGFVGIDLSNGTAMIASVVLGIAVDGTIHYLARFRREHRGDVLEVLGARPFASLPLRRSYVRENMLLIVQDAFDVDRATAIGLLDLPGGA